MEAEHESVTFAAFEGHIIATGRRKQLMSRNS
jgi:hypothetical protein